MDENVLWGDVLCVFSSLSIIGRWWGHRVFFVGRQSIYFAECWRMTERGEAHHVDDDNDETHTHHLTSLSPSACPIVGGYMELALRDQQLVPKRKCAALLLLASCAI